MNVQSQCDRFVPVSHLILFNYLSTLNGGDIPFSTQFSSTRHAVPVLLKNLRMNLRIKNMRILKFENHISSCLKGSLPKEPWGTIRMSGGGAPIG